MAEILIEDRDCEACGTEVRKGALFCYHCGASVAPEIAVAADIEGKRNGIAASGKTAEIPEEEADDEEFFDAPEDEEVLPQTDEDEEIIEETETSEETVSDEEETKLKTAAELRKKPKLIKKKRVEVVWEEPERPPNVRFLIVTLLLGGLALALWFVARYLG